MSQTYQDKKCMLEKWSEHMQKECAYFEDSHACVSSIRNAFVQKQSELEKTHQNMKAQTQNVNQNVQTYIINELDSETCICNGNKGASKSSGNGALTHPDQHRTTSTVKSTSAGSDRSNNSASGTNNSASSQNASNEYNNAAIADKLKIQTRLLF